MGPSPRVRGSPARSARSRCRRGSIPACAGKPARAGARSRPGRVHPRVCGEAADLDLAPSQSRGPSPRVRGSPSNPSDGGATTGSIPACAGKPHPGGLCCDQERVHPRVCGEASVSRPATHRIQGPSPRVRGSPVLAEIPRYLHGSIPACAGKPPRCCQRQRAARVHPRVCGEAHVGRTSAARTPGPSPRVRGSRGGGLADRVRRGSIPACAGKPTPQPRQRGHVRVHPRVCGEALGDLVVLRPGAGPSPRVRGSHVFDPDALAAEGSIPACAGKPSSRPRIRCGGQVHPRVCGESPHDVAVEPRVLGSIPACAGKPPPRPPPTGRPRVHPRVCGEAEIDIWNADSLTGPSPRVRGSQPPPDELADPGGSIPACAGKPVVSAPMLILVAVHPRVCGEAGHPRHWKRTRPGPSPRVRGSPAELVDAGGRGVHPRVCGEAQRRERRLRATVGPSPRVRGSPDRRAHARRAPGSIPACAGKPGVVEGLADSARVHPRVCGEASNPAAYRLSWNGPSPRVRGSPAQVIPWPSGSGSIPACAGKPPAYSHRPGSPWVHPRVCGEAQQRPPGHIERLGPSPRVRGSLAGRGPAGARVGSIPACAGKPVRMLPRPGRERVHPRVCGEAAGSTTA